MNTPNPWTDLPNEQPWVLPGDRVIINKFNESKHERFRVDPSLLPEPFIGRHDAPVVLLGLNPGWDANDKLLHANPEFIRLWQDNIQQKPNAFPFYYLSPNIAAPGFTWWKKKIRWLIEDAGPKLITQSLLCVEYFPYHSHKYHQGMPLIPSQAYSFELVRSAIKRRAIVVVMRSKRIWFEAVPELVSHSRCYCLRNPQNVAVSPGNCPAGFDAIVQAIKDHRPTG